LHSIEDQHGVVVEEEDLEQSCSQVRRSHTTPQKESTVSTSCIGLSWHTQTVTPQSNQLGNEDAGMELAARMSNDNRFGPAAKDKEP
jgi:hypothetical protein